MKDESAEDRSKDLTTVMTRRIMQLIADQTLVEVYRDRMAMEPLIGRIDSASHFLFSMTTVTEQGEYDGIAVASLSHITRIRWGSGELASTKKVMTAFPSERNISIPEKYSAIESINEIFGHIALYTELLDRNVCFIGEVDEMDEEVVLLNQYGTFKGRDRSPLILRLDQVTRMAADGRYERKLRKLFDVVK